MTQSKLNSKVYEMSDDRSFDYRLIFWISDYFGYNKLIMVINQSIKIGDEWHQRFKLVG